MRANLKSALFCAALLALGMHLFTADGLARDFPQGEECAAVSVQSHPFLGRYVAEYEGPFDRTMLYANRKCFASKKQCEDWRYHVQSLHTYYLIFENACDRRTE